MNKDEFRDWSLKAAAWGASYRETVRERPVRAQTAPGEIAARISNELFEYLDAPVRRVGATDTFVAYAPQVEDFILPQSEDVEKAVLELVKY